MAAGAKRAVFAAWQASFVESLFGGRLGGLVYARAAMAVALVELPEQRRGFR